jgi:hypothetical protein
LPMPKNARSPFPTPFLVQGGRSVRTSPIDLVSRLRGSRPVMYDDPLMNYL